MSTTVKGTKRLTSSSTHTNAINFAIEQMIHDTVHTAEVVSINAADQTGTDGAAGYATATPLVCQFDGFHQILPPAAIPPMPFLRPQAGKAAIVMDPQPGDKAVLVAMRRDSSGVASGKNDPVPPGSFRTYDQADGYLINGFLGETPEIWLHLNPASGDISLSTKAAAIDISCRESGDIDIRTAAGNITVTATDTGTVKAPQIVLDGNVRVTGNLTVEGVSEGLNGGPAVFGKGIVNKSGGFENNGGIRNSGGIANSGGGTASNGVSLEAHTHSGVLPGGGDTQKPNGGA